MSVRTQRLPHIIVQRVGNDFFAADTEAGVPAGCFVEDGTAVAIGPY